MTNAAPFRTRRPKKQLDGGGQRTGQRLVAREQGRDPSAANQAENLVDGRTRRFKVFLRRLRLRSKEEEALPKSAPLSLLPFPWKPFQSSDTSRPLPLNTVIIHQLSLS